MQRKHGNQVSENTSSDTVLKVQDFSLSFTRQRVQNLVDGISFEVKRGETLCIVGESGCGKSVTSMALMGLLPMPPARIMSGSAHFEGKDLFKLSDKSKRSIRGNTMSMIFQEPMTALNPAFTIGHQIAEIVWQHSGKGKEHAYKRALEMLKLVRIPAPEKRMNAYPHQLSGGMRQRAMIAMALANNPKLLIADEPTTALDVTIQAQILALMQTLQKETGTALVLITHDLGVVAEVADRVAVMYAGRIVETGTVKEIFEDPQHPYTIGLLGAIPSIGKRSGKLATIAGAVPAIENMPKGCRFAPRCPFALETCFDNVPTANNITDTHSVSCHFAPIEDTVVMPV